MRCKVGKGFYSVPFGACQSECKQLSGT
jgi:hypothetical protein